jgi:putative ABC transport system permease protein
MDESLYPLLARLPDVALASPLVERELDIERNGRTLKLRVIGLDAFRAGAVQPTLLPPAEAIGTLLEPGRIHLSHAAGRALGVQPGDVRCRWAATGTASPWPAGCPRPEPVPCWP